MENGTHERGWVNQGRELLPTPLVRMHAVVSLRDISISSFVSHNTIKWQAAHFFYRILTNASILLVYDPVRHDRPGEVGLGEVGLDEVGLDEVRPTEISPGEVGLGEFGLGEFGSAEVRPSDVGPGQVGSGEVGPSDVGPGQ